MKNLITTILAVLGATSVLVAQQPAASAPPKPELPPGPLLNRAPEFSQWTASFKSSPAEKPKPGEKAPPDSSDTVTVVTKTKSNYHVQMANGAGRKTNQWIVDGLQVMVLPNAQQPIISALGSQEYGGINFAKSDFPELSWISKNNFTDIKKVGGVDCLIFRDKIKPPMDLVLPEGEGQQAVPSTINALAVIAVETRLPVVMQLGEGVMTYVHGQPPSAMLTPPPDIASLIEKWRTRISAASKIPPP